MVSVRLALSLTLVSFLCASPAGELNVKAKEVVSQNGRDNSIVIKKNVLDVKEDDKNIIEENEEPIFRHGIVEVDLEDEPNRFVDDQIHDAIEREFGRNINDIIITEDEQVFEQEIIIDEYNNSLIDYFTVYHITNRYSIQGYII
ncbi:hypothetical protein CONCODRAFT_69891 [Conidiobolus coronatus NRRL 28638]|uniref:Uncharacterized protein n=1 Tax=Conidiobolus coronatus (strain ATCC 28846 / CBS 209.66 / NRRL 28638) TaxID=796925 RepID=A0A137P8S0_CONC2|nr:hypothetical protein CONCODRAFT_69891 [Conidiobolus coronatus NRRL 28638]|eukprot:KXN71405.1 hypothetical protein CONCODRAFT_69891 [Conidiobolus coronatus NRRL 28638]